MMGKRYATTVLNFATAIVGLPLIVLTACSSHLTRPAAKSQLEQLAKQAKEQNPDGPHSILVKIGTVANCEPSTSSGHDPVESDDSTAVLSATGYMTIRAIKTHVWDVELTELGNQSVAGDKYAHEQKGDCDQWQVTIPLAKYDHLDVTGIVEEGVHAKVDASLTFVITPVGLAVRKVAPGIIFEIDKKMYGEKLAQDFRDDNVKRLLGDDLVYTPSDKDRYIKQVTFQFEKYDDGWKPTKEH
jgi:hypothetical protein